MKLFKQVTLSMILGLAALLLASQKAGASVVFEDNFDSARTGSVLNIQRMPNWTVVGGSVDLIKSGDYFVTCAGGSGFCIDLDGSTKAAGGIATKTAFGPGLYSLSFDISGNQRSFMGGLAERGDAMMVTLGDWSQKVRVLADDSWRTVSIVFEAGMAGELSFSQLGMSYDYFGVILDNVTLSFLGTGGEIGNQSPEDGDWTEDSGAREVAVPEPAPLGAIGFALAFLGAAFRHRQGRATARAASACREAA